MKKTITILFTFFVLTSCNKNSSHEAFVDKLIIEKNKEIAIKYSNDLTAIEFVKNKSIKLNGLFENFLIGKENYYDSIISIWQFRKDIFSKEQLLQFKENIPENKCEIKLIQYKLLCSLENYYNEMFYKSIGVSTKVITEKNKIKVGDTLKAEIFLGMQITNYKEYMVIVGDDTLDNLPEGSLPIYKECFRQPGKYVREGEILIKSFNKMKEYPFSFVVEVKN